MQHSRLLFTKRAAAGALLLVLAAAGCDSKAESSSEGISPSPDTAATTTATASPAASQYAEPSASPSATADKSREAEVTQKPAATQKPKTTPKTQSPGGGKYTECADGDCKVSFSDSVTFPLAKWTVSATVKDGGVSVRLTNPNGLGGGGGFLAGPGCSVAVHADGSGRVGCDQPQAEPSRGGWIVHLLKLDGDTAVIRAMLG